MRGPIEQTWHVIYEVAFFLASILSRVVNATFYGGSMHQTLSARAHIEARDIARWRQIERRINRVFFWQADHCATAWQAEVTRARKTLARNGDL
jgi:hypothetical protein